MNERINISHCTRGRNEFQGRSVWRPIWSMQSSLIKKSKHAKITTRSHWAWGDWSLEWNSLTKNWESMRWRTNHCVTFVQEQRLPECHSTNCTRFEATTLEITSHATLVCFKNCESRKGYRYVLAFTDHATKWCWVYPMKRRNEFFTHFDDLVNVKLRACRASIQHYHADRGAALIGKRYLILWRSREQHTPGTQPTHQN